MDQNNEINDISNSNISQCEYNAWFYYQQPYVDVSQCNMMQNELFWPYPNNFQINSGFNGAYFGRTDISNIDSRSYHNNRQHNAHIHRNYEKLHKPMSNAIPKERKESNPQRLQTTFRGNNEPKNQQYEILSRNKTVEVKTEEVIEALNSLNIDKDFPPISTIINNVPDRKVTGNEKVLDFKSALQKPKKEPDEKVISTPDEVDIIKKKRRRSRKKKVLEDAKPFEYVDDDFPNLDAIKQELNNIVENVNVKHKEKTIQKLDISIDDKDKKKLRRRQLLLILPKELQGQVKIVEAKSIKKSKIKRKVFQDRIKRPVAFLNPLDISGPTIKRGKERLIPKVKKPSKLKKSILLCRSQKKDIRDAFKNMSLTTNDTNECQIDTSVKIEEIKPKSMNNPINKMHSKNFREYCNHMIGNNINSILTTLLKTLINFQDKLYNRDPIKAKIKRRLCFGLREVTKFVSMKKLRLIIIAPNLEKVDIEGGLDDIVFNIIKVARESSIPCVFGLNRGSLAYICFKKFRVGAIGIFNYDGAETHVKELLKAVDEAREQYNQLKQIMETITEDVSGDDKEKANQQHCDTFVGHSRTPSNALSEPISDIVEVNRSTFNSIFEDQNHNSDSRNVVIDFTEDEEDSQIEAYVEDVLNSVLKLNLND